MIHPRVVVTLGNFSTKLLLNTETGITRLRGQRFDWWLGATLVPTFHPAAALRGRPQVRDQMAEDFRMVRSILDGPRESNGASSDAEPVQSALELNE
jgi:DNA polymerase